jgi:hypothetical protein
MSATRGPEQLSPELALMASRSRALPIELASPEIRDELLDAPHFLGDAERHDVRGGRVLTQPGPRYSRWHWRSRATSL